MNKKVEIEKTSEQPPIISKKISKTKFDKSKIKKVMRIDFPEEINDSKSSRRYKIRITFSDDCQKPHSKTILFGKKEQSEFIDHKNEREKQKRLSHLRKCCSPADSNYYTLHLLNGESDSLIQNYLNLRKINGLLSY